MEEMEKLLIESVGTIIYGIAQVYDIPTDDVLEILEKALKHIEGPAELFRRRDKG